MTDELPELAYYYPEWVWYNSDWVKNLILFFDGIALLVPNYMRDRPSFVDPAIVTGLQEHGLLTILEPETVIGQKATEALATAMADILASGALDKLAREQTKFHELSYSRLGYSGDPDLAKVIYEELRSRGLAKPSEDGVSIPMHPMVRSLILVLLAQFIRPIGRERGLSLNPTTDRPQIQEALAELLNLPTMASSGHVVSLDLQTVGVDVSVGEIPRENAFEILEQLLQMNGQGIVRQDGMYVIVPLGETTKIPHEFIVNPEVTSEP